MLVLNPLKDPEMGLLTNFLYVRFSGTCWEFRMVEYFEIGHNVLVCEILIMPLPLHVNVILFFKIIFPVPDHIFCNKLLYMNTLN